MGLAKGEVFKGEAGPRPATIVKDYTLTPRTSTISSEDLRAKPNVVPRPVADYTDKPPAARGK